MRSLVLSIVGLGFGLAASTAMATPIKPTAYDMPNGNTGAFNYWDESYGGTGATGNPLVDGSPLAGGLGDLTDGFISNQRWSPAESPVGPGPYVGWVNVNPIITFHFAPTPTITSITLHLADDDGSGGVDNPSAVIIDGTNYNVLEPAGADPFAFTVGGLAITNSSFDIQLIRQNAWTFMSEVEFDATVPLPAPVFMLGGALAAMGIAGRARRRG